ncbi:MAG: protein kinase [Gemmataceae bacterium]|nr:protein kinase [Gemmataceae bacterium]
MTAPLTPTMIERIDEVCDRFEAAWKAGKLPRVEDYLDAEAVPLREALHRELLRVDAYYRRRADAASTLVRGTGAPPPERPVVAGYEVLGELGRGGMGVVYKARQLRPNRLVALKMISGGAHAGAGELERFQREAEAVAQLQDPHIVQVYEVGEQDGRPYFTMEYVAGGSLDRFLAGTPQPPHAAAQLVERLAHAIHHAHGRGIIHRDLKPANVLLQIADCGLEIETSGSRLAVFQSTIDNLQSAIPKITDFGLAKLMHLSAVNPTQTGDMLGTPSYMAPEQLAECAEISAATDVYGLGAILYELLTGRPPFRGQTPLETMLQVQTVEPVSPSRLQPKCPRDLVTICLKCLSKQPRQRYATALELAEDLRRFLDGQPIRARPVGPLHQVLKWTRRQPVVASLAGLLLLAVTLGVGTGSWLWWRAEDGLKQAKDALAKERTARAERVATLDRFQVALAHREWLANNAARAETLLDSCTPEQQDTWEWRYLDRMRHSALRTFPGHENIVQALAVHPKRNQVVSVSHDYSVLLWDLDTGRKTTLGKHKHLALAAAYSPDGRLLASSGSHDGIIKLWDAQTGAPLPPDIEFGGKDFKSTDEVAVWSLAFDPSSRYLAAGGPRRLKVWDTRDRNWYYNRLADISDICQVAFSPDGHYLATASWHVRVWDWKAKASKPEYEWPGHGIRTLDLAFSPDGNLLASCGRDSMVRVHSLLTEKEEFSHNGHQLSVTSVCFSPGDGARLASAGQEGDMQVWSVKERRRLHTIHGHSGIVWDLVYSTDGKRLISAGHDSLVRVWDAAGNQEAVTLPVQVAQQANALAYSPDGRLLAWGDAWGGVGLWDFVKEKAHTLEKFNPALRNPISSFAFCPAGRQVAWRNGAGVAKLWDLDRAEEIPLINAGQVQVRGLAFSADGKRLLTAYAKDAELHVRDLLTGHDVLTLPRSGRTQVVWSPDARRFMTVEDRKYARVWDTETGRLVADLGLQPSMTCITFNADGRFLALGGVEGKMFLWDVTANREIMAVTGGHTGTLYGLAVSPDGRRLASAASDCTAKLWDTQTRHEVLTLRTQLHEKSPLAFSPDGADLVSVSNDNHLQIWSTRRVHRVP